MEKIGPTDGRENLDTVFTEVDLAKNVVGFANGVAPGTWCDFSVLFCRVLKNLYSASLNVALTVNFIPRQRLTRHNLG